MRARKKTAHTKKVNIINPHTHKHTQAYIVDDDDKNETTTTKSKVIMMMEKRGQSAVLTR